MKKINLPIRFKIVIQTLFVLPLLFASAALWGDVEFTELNLSSDNHLIFRAQADSPAYGSFDTLLMSDLDDSTLFQLTCFPEQVIMLHLSEQLQIQNRFGVFRTDPDLENIQPIEIFSSFIAGGEISTGKISPQGSSPDGRFLLYLKPRSAAYSDLVLFDTLREKNYPIAENIELDLSGNSISWSPDSEYFVYSRDHELFYYSIEQIKKNRVIHGSYRKIGQGNLKNVSWSTFNDLYYASGDLVYRIKSGELFARSLYSDLLNIGEVVGKIPFQFNPGFDTFMISPDGRKILYNKNGRNIFLYYLKSDEFRSLDTSLSLPFLHLPDTSLITDIAWDSADLITLLSVDNKDGSIENSLYRIDLSQPDKPLYFETLENNGYFDMLLHDDEDRVALISESGVSIRDYRTWTEVFAYDHAQPLQLLWRDDDSVIIAGRWKTELVNLRTRSSKLIALSQPGSFSFSGEDEDVATTVNGTDYLWDTENNRWKDDIESIDAVKTETSTSEFRVFSEELATGSYRNIIMVRDLNRYTTEPLFGAPKAYYEEFPEEEGLIDFNVFNHGSRIRRREVALVFNAIDTDEGLTEILAVLEDYGIRATFFINGEFIQRNPGGVRAIAASDHEVGSLFHVYFDLTDSRYRIDEDFVRKGLGRNEDDYFNASGEELSLLWHAPYYAVNSEILDSAKNSRYSYIGRDLDPLDWVTRDDSSMGLYLSSHQIIERIIELKQPGSIIPVRIGRRQGEREDYLFQYLDVLLNSLINLGYDIVPVSTLVEHAK